jgi:hypothetical protein
MVAEHTFRPPYYHRNCMTEFMGMVWGKYDAKAGFMPGGASLHSCMTPHGPDKNTFDKASDPSQEQKPVYFDQGLAFMFECNAMLQVVILFYSSIFFIHSCTFSYAHAISHISIYPCLILPTSFFFCNFLHHHAHRIYIIHLFTDSGC